MSILTHISIIVVFSCVNRLYRIATRKEPMPKDHKEELTNLSYTIIGSAVIYASVWMMIQLILIIVGATFHNS